MKNKAITILLLIVLGLSISARHLWYINKLFFYIGDALAWPIALGIIVWLTVGYAQIIAEAIFLLTLSNLLDEVFFDPVTIGINEYVFFTIITVWTIIRLRKCRISGMNL